MNSNRTLFTFLFLALLYISCGSEQTKNTKTVFVFEQNFNESQNGNLTTSEIKREWKEATFLWGIKDRIWFYLGMKGHTPNIVGECNKQLEVVIPAHTAGPIPGMQWSTKFKHSYTELTLEYDVKFDSSFNFAKGGKLPGLAGGLANTGGKKPTGSDGWSARMMFWEGGKLCFWLYHQNQPGEFGDSLFFKKDETYFAFERGKWYTIKHHLKINSENKADGVIEGFINDTLYASRTNLKWTNTEKLSIDQLIFSVFLGGEGKVYESNKNEKIYFDNFKVTQGQ